MQGRGAGGELGDGYVARPLRRNVCNCKRVRLIAPRKDGAPLCSCDAVSGEEENCARGSVNGDAKD